MSISIIPSKASDLKAYLEMFKSEKSWEKYADFNLLIFLSNLIDIEVINYTKERNGIKEIQKERGFSLSFLNI